MEEDRRGRGGAEPGVSDACTSSKGLRAEAPDFVPGAMGEITSTDEFLEVLTGMPVSELALSHRQAVARARHCAARHSASQLFIPVKA